MRNRFISVAVLPIVAFVATFFITFLAAGLIDAYAQPAPGSAEQPAAGSAEQPVDPTNPPTHMMPSDEAPPTGAEPAQAGVDGAQAHATTEAAAGTTAEGEAEELEDPTQHFNFTNMDYRGKDELGGKFGDGKMIDPATGKVAHGEEEPMSAPFMFMIFNFVVLMAILAWKLRPAGHQVARERHDTIKTALDEAAKLRQQAADKLAEYEKRLAAADGEIKALVEGMRKDAESDKARILANAEKQAAQMKRDAELRIAAEIELARATLTREVTAAAATATEKILREKMVADDQQKLVGAFITGVQSSQSSTTETR